MERPDLFYRWLGSLIELEGSEVVLEPNRKWSRYGVTKATYAEAEKVTRKDMFSLAREYWTRYYEDYDSVSASALETLRMIDFAWNAGPGRVSDIVKALRPGLRIGGRDLSAKLIRDNANSITEAITFLYEHWGAVNPEMAPYLETWRRRRESLRETYYNLDRKPYETPHDFTLRVKAECQIERSRWWHHPTIEGVNIFSACHRKSRDWEDEIGDWRLLSTVDRAARRINRAKDFFEVVW